MGNSFTDRLLFQITDAYISRSERTLFGYTKLMLTMYIKTLSVIL